MGLCQIAEYIFKKLPVTPGSAHGLLIRDLNKPWALLVAT